MASRSGPEESQGQMISHLVTRA